MSTARMDWLRRALVTVATAVFMTLAVIAAATPNFARAGAETAQTDVVFIATGQNFPDALGAGPVAALAWGPILLVSQNAIPPETLAELTRLAPPLIVIIGGTGAVSDLVETGLNGLPWSPEVLRVAGSNRYETAALISQLMFPVSVGSYLPIAVHAELGASEQLAPTGQQVADPDECAGLSCADKVLVSVPITAPADGVIIVNYTVNVFDVDAGHPVECVITFDYVVGFNGVDGSQMWESPGDPSRFGTLAATVGIDVVAGQSYTIQLRCRHNSATGIATMRYPSLNAVWYQTFPEEQSAVSANQDRFRP